jgi:hypothetical protein
MPPSSLGLDTSALCAIIASHRLVMGFAAAFGACWCRAGKLGSVSLLGPGLADGRSSRGPRRQIREPSSAVSGRRLASRLACGTAGVLGAAQAPWPGGYGAQWPERLGRHERREAMVSGRFFASLSRTCLIQPRALKSVSARGASTRLGEVGVDNLASAGLH